MASNGVSLLMSEENFDCSHVPGKGRTTVSNTLSEFSFIAPCPRWGKSGWEELRKFPGVPRSQRHDQIKPQLSDSTGQMVNSLLLDKADKQTWPPQSISVAWELLLDNDLDSILKSRDITFTTKVRLVSATVFPVLMNGCENWNIMKAECWRIGAFGLSCWRRLLKVPWIARKSNQSILKEISPEYSLEGLMLKLKLQYFATWWEEKNWLTGKDPPAGNDWRQKEKGTTEDEMVGWHHRLNGHEFE